MSCVDISSENKNLSGIKPNFIESRSVIGKAQATTAPTFSLYGHKVQELIGVCDENSHKKAVIYILIIKLTRCTNFSNLSLE
jgi:hypothetical protein